MTENIKKYDGKICEFGYYEFNVAYHRYNIETMKKADNAEESFKLFYKLSQECLCLQS